MLISKPYAYSNHILRYRWLRKNIGMLVPSNYDISNKCNLKCEGCLFFEGDDYGNYKDANDDLSWDSFFADEASRGVNFAYIAGAEPSLELNRIRLAAKHIRSGVVFTNGTRRIPDDINYQIHISLWGGQEQTEYLRGFDTTLRAIQNYANDPRAHFVYTINSVNINEIYKTAQRLHDAGQRLTFSYFSPTVKYLRKLADGTANDGSFFRFSQAERNLIMTVDDFRRARQAIVQVLSDFGETIVYSLDYDDWISNPDGVYTLDPETGVALDCGMRETFHHRHYNVDLTPSLEKCCSPNVSCSGCRAYAQGYGTFLHRFRGRRKDSSQFAQWLAVWELWVRLFLGVTVPESSMPESPISLDPSSPNPRRDLSAQYGNA